MKKRFVYKNILSKMSLILVIVLLLEFSISKPVSAVTNVGGTLLEPVVSFIASLGDGVISILQNALLGQEKSFAYIDLLQDASIAFKIGPIEFEGIDSLWNKKSWIRAISSGIGMIAGFFTGGPLGMAAGFVATNIAFVKTPLGDLVLASLGDVFTYANIEITPEAILQNTIGFFDVDFFSTEFDDKQNEGEQSATESISIQLRKVVRQLYVTIRDISLIFIVIVTIVLIIKMLMGINPQERRRIGEGLFNCIKGLALIVVMHFIMAIAVSINNQLAASVALSGFDTSNVYSTKEEAEAALASGGAQGEKIGGVEFTITEKADEKPIYEYFKDERPNKVAISSGGGKYKTTFYATNFTEVARYSMQKAYEVDDEGERGTTAWERMGWCVVYVLFVIVTVIFVWMYGKRVVYMAILTVLAPIVGLMYPINRADGGRAQSLNYWLREYMGTLFMQPFHLLIYSVLIDSAMNISLKNPIYTLIALLGMIIAEKFVRELIGIRDTGIGNLGGALAETTRGINSTIRNANRAAQTVSRMASNGLRAGANALRNARKEDEEEEEENRIRTTEQNAGMNLENEKQKYEAYNEEDELYQQALNEQKDKNNTWDNEALLDYYDNNKELEVDEDELYQNALDEKQEADDNTIDNGELLLDYMDGDNDYLQNDEDNDMYNENDDKLLLNQDDDIFDENDDGIILNQDNDDLYNEIDGENLLNQEEIDENGDMAIQRYMESGYDKNSLGWYYNPNTDEYDPDYDPRNDENFKTAESSNNASVSFDTNIDNEATMRNYYDAGYDVNEKGWYFNPYTDNYEAQYNPKEDPMFVVTKDESTNSGKSVNGLSPSTLNMAKELKSGSKAQPSETKNFLGSNGTINAYGTSDGNIEITRISSPNGKDPMAMAMGKAANDDISINVGSMSDSAIGGNQSVEMQNSDISNSNRGGIETSKGTGGSRSYSSSSGARSFPDANLGNNDVDINRIKDATSNTSELKINTKEFSGSSEKSGGVISSPTSNMARELKSNSKAKPSENKNFLEGNAISYETNGTSTENSGRTYANNGRSYEKLDKNIETEKRTVEQNSNALDVSFSDIQERDKPEITTINEPQTITEELARSAGRATGKAINRVKKSRAVQSVQTVTDDLGEKARRTVEKIDDTTDRTVENIKNTETFKRVEEAVNYAENTRIGKSISKTADIVVDNVSETARNAAEYVENLDVKDVKRGAASALDKMASAIDKGAKGINAVATATSTAVKATGDALDGRPLEAVQGIIDATLVGGNAVTRNATPQSRTTNTSREVQFVIRENSYLTKEQAKALVSQCKKYKAFDDERNIALFGDVQRETGNRRDELAKIAAKVIKGKRTGMSLEKIEKALEREKISNREKQALIEFYKKVKA